MKVQTEEARKANRDRVLEGYRNTGIRHFNGRGPDITENTIRSPFSEPCWRCNARGACRHRSPYA